MANTFPCTSCGLCCQNIGSVEELAPFDLGDGVCKHLIDNMCAIYDERPDICRVDRMYELVYYAYFTKAQFYEENEKVCKELQLKHGYIEEE